MSGLLNWILWLPFLGVLGILFIPKEKEGAIRWWSVLVTGITLIVCLVLYKRFDEANAAMQFTFSMPWIKQFHINYKLGVDGISLPMILINALLFFICCFSSFDIKKSIKGYYILLLALQGSVFGVFMALDFFLFYVFWEIMLLPMFFLIGIWGGENKEYAAIKFFLYTFFGSILMLIGIIALYFAAEGKLGVETFDMVKLMGGHFTDLKVSFFGSEFSFDKNIFCLYVHWVCHQGSNFPFSYLAASCSRSGTNGRFSYTGWCFTENGDLWIFKDLLSNLSRLRQLLCRLYCLVRID